MRTLSKLKIKSAFFELFVFVCVETEQLRRAMPARHECFFERKEQAEAQDLFSKISFVQFCSQHCLVEMLKRNAGVDDSQPRPPLPPTSL